MSFYVDNELDPNGFSLAKTKRVCTRWLRVVFLDCFSKRAIQAGMGKAVEPTANESVAGELLYLRQQIYILTDEAMRIYNRGEFMCPEDVLELLDTDVELSEFGDDHCFESIEPLVEEAREAYSRRFCN